MLGCFFRNAPTAKIHKKDAAFKKAPPNAAATPEAHDLRDAAGIGPTERWSFSLEQEG